MKPLLPATLLTAAIATLFLAAAPNPQIGPTPAQVPAPNATLLPNALWLDTLGIENIEQSWGTPGKNKSVDGRPITLRGTTFSHGVGSHANGSFRIPLDGKAEKFLATVGIDDEVTTRGSARVIVTVDNKEVFRSPILNGGGALANLDVNLANAKELLVTLSDEGNNDSDHVDFGNAQLVFAATPPNPNTFRIAAPAPVAAEEKITLPLSIPADGKPQINGPRITGATPGRPFIYQIPATGDNLTFAAEGLPNGLSVDAKTGLITGALKAPLAQAVTLHAKNDKGESIRQFVIVGGTHQLALTPPLGWNSWNCYGGAVSDANMRAAADGMVKSGLASHGFAYVNLDDGWAPRPGANAHNADGIILPNNKFPNMKALGDYIHSKGLKFGTYSGPGTTTCQRLEASLDHEEIDAKTWASWGVDYIKYDLCSYDQVAAAAGNERTPAGIAAHKLPYQKMRTALDKLDRDVVYSLCQYNRTLQVYIWGSEEGISGNLWRVTGDISTGQNVWTSMSGIGFQQNGHEVGAAPGHWNDTDMLVVGSVGLANGGRPRPTFLTQNEQLTHIGLWSMLAAPLLLGCDMNAMDDFTKNLMENDEVLAIDQDPLGKQAWRISALNADDTPAGNAAPATPPAGGGGGGRGRGGAGGNAQNSAVKQIWARPLWDGTCAVGFFNLGADPTRISISLKELNNALKTNFAAGASVRDVWLLKNLAPAGDTISAEVPRHGMVLVKIGTPNPDSENIIALVKMRTPK